MTGKGRKNTDGFTLIELIVVIAVLTILAGILVAAYFGYLRKSNDRADELTVSQVAKALELQYYTQGLTGSASVRLSADGMTLTGTGDDFITQAMENTFGENWPSVSLRPLDSNDTQTPVSGDAMLLEEIRKTVGDVRNHPMLGTVEGSNTELVHALARETAETNWEDKWSDGTLWDHYIQENAEQKDIAFFADVAVIRARNIYLARYLLSQNAIDDAGYAKLCELTADRSYIPEDFAGKADNKSYIEDLFGEAAEKISATIDAYYAKDENGASQATRDAQNYKELMQKINTLQVGTVDWDSLVAAATRDEQPGGVTDGVVITITADGGGFCIDIASS